MKQTVAMHVGYSMGYYMGDHIKLYIVATEPWLNDDASAG
jgi:hypothetical protein